MLKGKNTESDPGESDAKGDIGILITDHQVREALEICDRAYIVNEGHIIAKGSTDSILSDRMVRQVYLGNDFSL